MIYATCPGTLRIKKETYKNPHPQHTQDTHTVKNNSQGRLRFLFGNTMRCIKGSEMKEKMKRSSSSSKSLFMKTGLKKICPTLQGFRRYITSHVPFGKQILSPKRRLNSN